MLTFLFEAYGDQVDGRVDSLSQGHISAKGQYGGCSTKQMNRSVMLLLSVIELLSGLHFFLQERTGRQFTFRAVDGSFCLKFVQVTQGQIAVYCGSKAIVQSRISTVHRHELIEAVWKAVQILQTNYIPEIDPNDDHESGLWNQIEEDIESSFRTCIEQWLNAFPDLKR